VAPAVVASAAARAAVNAARRTFGTHQVRIQLDPGNARINGPSPVGAARVPSSPNVHRPVTHRFATLRAPSADDFARASRIIEAYAHATGEQARGAVMFGDEMIDEASHKMARAIVAKGRAAGLARDGSDHENTQ
jgi:hypothetical protein